MALFVEPAATAYMQQHLVLTLGEVVEQTGLSEAVRLKVVPRHIAKVTLIKVDVKNTDDGARLVLLVCHFLVNLCNLEVIKNAVGKHEAHQRLVVE